MSSELDAWLSEKYSKRYRWKLMPRRRHRIPPPPSPPPSPTVDGQTIIAASASLTDVQAAVDVAADGYTVLIPNGSATWTSGVATTKQIRIKAQNYTPTSGGSATRNVTITNNSTTAALFSFVTGNSYHVGVSGIRFIDQTSSLRNDIVLNGSGSKVALINDCTFDTYSRFGNSDEGALIFNNALGGVFWNLYFTGLGTGGTQGVGHDGGSLHIQTPRAWTTASTMGTADTNGDVNLYLEDSSVYNIGQFPDVDNGGRAVIRYCTLDGSGGLTHGFTSTVTGRHFELYNNTFNVTNENRNGGQRFFWIRGGTGVLTDNVINNASFPGAYGSTHWSIGDNTTPGTYPQYMQPGWGHNGTNHVLDPIYEWNDSGAQAYVMGVEGGWETIVVQDREYYVNNGAKPGYSKYTYPHPLRSD